MMTEIVRYTCDRCRLTVEIPSAHRTPEGWTMITTSHREGTLRPATIDLCATCSEEHARWTSTPTGESATASLAAVREIQRIVSDPVGEEDDMAAIASTLDTFGFASGWTFDGNPRRPAVSRG